MKAADRQLGEHTEAARRRLVHLHGLARKTDVAEWAILRGAQARLEAVEKELAELRPKAMADDAAGERYTALVLERGQLSNVIAESQRVLGQ